MQNEKIIETKNCINCGKSYFISEKEKILQLKLSVKDLSICYDCGLQNLLAYWPSIGKWYKRKCDFSGEIIITNYPINSRFPIYKENYFYSDKWIIEYQEINNNKTFFTQLKELQEKIPRPHMLGINNENCDYCDDSWNSKNCYLAISILECENLYYSYRNIRCKISTDLVFCFDCQNCYNLIYSTNCYKVYYGLNVENSSNSLFLYDCKNVENCLMCWNLRGKKYFILNKQYSKEEYEDKLSKINLGSSKMILELEKEFNENIKNNALHRASMNMNCENVQGNFVINSKNCSDVYLFDESDYCSYIIRGFHNTDCMMSVGLLDSQLCYGICQSSYLYNVKFSSYSINCNNSEYLDNCVNCKDCFGCVGLKNKQYCILNKEYSKNDYEKYLFEIKEKMILENEYGKFFPYNMAYSGYNTTLARFYYPHSKDEIENLGGYWENLDNIKHIVNDYKIPDDIKDVNNDILDKTLVCEKTGNIYNFNKQVLDFHKKNNIPLPKVSHIQRMIDNYYSLTFIKPYKGKCYISGKDIIHYYGPELKYLKIVSDEEYDKEIEA